MEYKPGDIENGHILGHDNQWHPVNGSAPAAGPAPAAQAPRKSRKLLWVVGGILALLVLGGIGSALSGGSKQASTSSTSAAAPKASAATESAAPTSSAAAPAAAPGMNQAVRDGKFEFVVSGVDCSKTKVGDEYLNKTAQGKFCIVALSVKNIGNEAQTFSSFDQKAKDAQGRTLETDSEAGIYLKESNSWLNKINPGNQVKGSIVFDVPKDGTLTELTLHDSAFSGGVTVKLG